MNIVLMTTFHKRPDSPQNLSRGRDGNGLLGTMKNVNCLEPDPGTSPSVQGDDFRASYAGEPAPRLRLSPAPGGRQRRPGRGSDAGDLCGRGDGTGSPPAAGHPDGAVARRGGPPQLVDHFRRQAREERKLVLVSGEVSVDHPPVWSNRTFDQLLTSLLTLPPLQRAAIGLRYLDDLPVADVARLLGRSVHATESLLARGRDGLRSHYLEHADD